MGKKIITILRSNILLNWTYNDTITTIAATRILLFHGFSIIKMLNILYV